MHFNLTFYQVRTFYHKYEEKLTSILLKLDHYFYKLSFRLKNYLAYYFMGQIYCNLKINQYYFLIDKHNEITDNDYQYH